MGYSISGLNITRGTPVSLHTRDDKVDKPTNETPSFTGARTETDAVKAALRHEIERVTRH
jgi:hypothetical protein